MVVTPAAKPPLHTGPPPIQPRSYFFALDQREIYTDERGRRHTYRAGSSSPQTTANLKPPSHSLLNCSKPASSSNSSHSSPSPSRCASNGTGVKVSAVESSPLLLPEWQAWERSKWSDYQRSPLPPFLEQQQQQQQKSIGDSVAVCLVGGLRAFPRADVRDGFAAFVLARNDWKVQLFVVGHAKSAPGKRERHELRKPHTFWENVDAVRSLAPRMGVVFEHEASDWEIQRLSSSSSSLSQQQRIRSRRRLTERRRLRASCEVGEDAPHAANCAPQLRHRSECMELVKQAEKENDTVGGRRSFDWVVSMRPDVLFRGPLPSITSFHKGIVWTLSSLSAHRCNVHLKDILVLIPRAHADSFMTAMPREIGGCRMNPNYKKVAQVADRRRVCGCEPAGGCECVIFKYLALKKIPVGFFESDVAIVREGTCPKSCVGIAEESCDCAEEQPSSENGVDDDDDDSSSSSDAGVTGNNRTSAVVQDESGVGKSTSREGEISPKVHIWHDERPTNKKTGGLTLRFM